MFSIKTPRCSKPRPETWNSSGVAPSCTRSATFSRISRCSRSRICRLVRYFPSRPQKGESLIRNVMCKVGSSTVTRSSRLFLPRGTDGVSDLDGIDAFDGHQIPCFHHFRFGLAQSGKAGRFQNPTFFDAICGTDRNIRPRLHHPAFDSPDRNPPGVLRPVQVGHQQLQWSLGITNAPRARDQGPGSTKEPHHADCLRGNLPPIHLDPTRRARGSRVSHRRPPTPPANQRLH